MSLAISDIHDKRVIIAPLFWGLGHATRCIPIIKKLLIQGNHIALASDGEALTLLKSEFPQLEHYTLPSYNISYKYTSMLVNMAYQAPSILNVIKGERLVAQKLAEMWNADLIISDNRLGFLSSVTKNIYITHQINIPHSNSIIGAFASKAHQKYINKYDQCWVPDSQHPGNITGKMSLGGLKIPKTYIGVLSRFVHQTNKKLYDYMAILSGPEPQRTYLEDKIITLFNKYPQKKLCLVKGTSKSASKSLPNINIKTYGLVGSQELNALICASSTIICRAGYTSIMDLIHLNKTSILIPTPGQYEQKYLGKTLSKNSLFTIIDQKKLSQYKL